MEIASAESPKAMPPEDEVRPGPPPDGRPRGGRLSDILAAIAADTARDRISVADLAAILSQRAFGALMFIFALPNVFPTPPGTSTILGAPLLFLAAQLALNRAVPWLPKVIARRSIARRDFIKLVQRVAPWLAKAERMLAPRYSFLTRPPFEQGIGLVCLILAIILFLPIPLGNILPALAIALFSLAILERDGIAALVAGAVTIVSLAVVSGVVYGIVVSAIFLIRQTTGF